MFPLGLSSWISKKPQHTPTAAVKPAPQPQTEPQPTRAAAAASSDHAAPNNDPAAAGSQSMIAELDASPPLRLLDEETMSAAADRGAHQLTSDSAAAAAGSIQPPPFADATTADAVDCPPTRIAEVADDHTTQPEQLQLQSLMNAALTAADATDAATGDSLTLPLMDGSSSTFQRVASRIFDNAVTPPQQNQLESPIAAAAASASSCPPQPSLPAALLLVKVLDELLSSRQSPINESQLRSLGRQLGCALCESIRRPAPTAQADIRDACDSIQRATRTMIKAAAADCSSAEYLTLSRFIDSFGRACPPIMLWCLLTQLDQLIGLCTESASEAAARSASGTQHPTSELRGLSRLTLIEQSCILCQHIESALESLCSVSSAARLSASSASVVLLSSLGVDWRAVWMGKFAAAGSGHLQSRALCVLSPMLLSALWALMERMPATVQLSAIEAATSDSAAQTMQADHERREHDDGAVH